MADSIITVAFVLMTLIGGVLALYFRELISGAASAAIAKLKPGKSAEQTAAPDSRQEPGFWSNAEVTGEVSADGDGLPDIGSGDGTRRGDAGD